MSEDDFAQWAKGQLVTIESQQAENERLKWFEKEYYNALEDYQNAAKVLEREGFYKCTAAACNCNSWHFKGGDDEQ